MEEIGKKYDLEVDEDFNENLKEFQEGITKKNFGI